MSIARTYFFNRIDDDGMARLVGDGQNFFLENVDPLNPTVTRIQALLHKEGLSSEVILAPTNPAPSLLDLAPGLKILPLVWAFLRRGPAAWRTRRDSDMATGHATCDAASGHATLRLTSSTSMSVTFSTPKEKRPDR